MTNTETNIASKILSEIEAAEPVARTVAVAELSAFYDLVERRINLTKLEAGAESFAGKVEDAAKGVASQIESDVASVVHEVESRL